MLPFYVFPLFPINIRLNYKLVYKYLTSSYYYFVPQIVPSLGVMANLAEESMSICPHPSSSH